MPVITLVVYLGASEWDGPMSIHEMLSTKNKHLLRFVPDYRIHLIAPAQMEDKDFLKFRTDFGKVLQYIKYSKDKEKLYQVTHEGDRFKDVEQDSADLINVVTGSELKYEVKGGRVNMCTAIDEMRKESENKGALTMLAGLVKKGLLSLSDAAKEAGLTPAEFLVKTAGMK